MTWLSKQGIPSSKSVEGSKDYDIIDINKVTYEVKNDEWFNKTNNLCIETIENIYDKTKGWLFSSNADKIVYFTSEKDFFIFLRKDLLKFYNSNIGIYKEIIHNLNKKVKREGKII